MILPRELDHDGLSNAQIAKRLVKSPHTGRHAPPRELADSGDNKGLARRAGPTMKRWLDPLAKTPLFRRFSHVVPCEGGVIPSGDEGSSVPVGGSIENPGRRVAGSRTASSVASQALGSYGIVVEEASSPSEHVESSIYMETKRVFGGAELSSGYAVVDLTPEFERGWPTMIVVGDYLDPALAEVDRTASRTGNPYLLARLARDSVWLGPYIDPGRSACWHCLREPLCLNLGSRVLVQAPPATSSSVREVRQPTFVGAATLLLELMKAFRDAPEGMARLLGTMFVCRDRPDQVERHLVRRLESCRHCGIGATSPSGNGFRASPRRP